MDKQLSIQEQVIAQGILPLFYHDDQNTSFNVVKALYDGGIRAVEYTNRGAGALENFKHLVKERNQSMPGLLLCIGTIKSENDATKFIEAGADVLISPFFDSSVADVAYMNKTLYIPGCMTPTDINEAEKAGCTLIKLFPGNVLGPTYVQTIMPLFPQLKFMVTGGVDATKESIQSWFDAGVVAVGMGSKLLSPSLLNESNYSIITDQTKALLEMMEAIKSSSETAVD